MSMKKHRERQQKQGGHADTHLDTDDQKHLREVVLEEVEAVMRKHQCGGVVLINSFESAAWRYVLPEWGGLSNQSTDAGMAMRMRIRAKSDPKQADATMGFIKSIRDFAGQVHELFDQLWERAVKEIGVQNVFDVYGYDMSEEGKPKPPKSGDDN